MSKHGGLRFTTTNYDRFVNCARTLSARMGVPIAVSDMIRKFAMEGLERWEQGEKRAKVMGGGQS